MSPLSNNMIMTRVATGGGGSGGSGGSDPSGGSFTYRIKHSVTTRSGSDAPGMSYAYDGRSATLGNVDPVGGCFILESAERNTGNGNKKFTFSFWIKGRHVGTILRHYDDGDSIKFDADDKLVITADEYSARGEFFSSQQNKGSPTIQIGAILLLQSIQHYLTQLTGLRYGITAEQFNIILQVQFLRTQALVFTTVQ